MLSALLYVLLFLGALFVPYIYFVRPWYVRWGTTYNEARAPLPGDEVVPSPRMQSTRAITVHAPPERVWPWIAQIGQGRGGFYSYQWLENLLGCKIKNADSVVDKWQDVNPGDIVRLAPGSAPYFLVDCVDAGRALILRGAAQTNGDDDGTVTSWSFILQPIETGHTRLLVRTRYAFPTTIMNFILWRVFVEPASFVMEQKMLRGIRQRAEAGLPTPSMTAPV